MGCIIVSAFGGGSIFTLVIEHWLLEIAPDASSRRSRTSYTTDRGTTFDIHLNDRAYWRTVPAAAWDCDQGGYQLPNKWLPYRGCGVLGRALRPEQVEQFTATARRIVGISGLVGEG